MWHLISTVHVMRIRRKTTGGMGERGLNFHSQCFLLEFLRGGWGGGGNIFSPKSSGVIPNCFVGIDSGNSDFSAGMYRIVLCDSFLSKNLKLMNFTVKKWRQFISAPLPYVLYCIIWQFTALVRFYSFARWVHMIPCAIDAFYAYGSDRSAGAAPAELSRTK